MALLLVLALVSIVSLPVTEGADYEDPALDFAAKLGSLKGGGGGGGGGADEGDPFDWASIFSPQAAKTGPGSPECPHMAPKLESHLMVEANGCGPKGMHLSEPYGLVKCCNRHDVCYWLCNTEHAFCEKKFASCMKKVCNGVLQDQREACKEQANSFSSMTRSFGKGYHAQGQQMTCDCFDSADEANERHREFVMRFFRHYNESAANDENVDALMEQYEGKEGGLYYKLVLEFGRNFVKFDGTKAEL